MLGITEIATYLPSAKWSNYDRKDKFSLDDDFIENKIGVRALCVKEKSEKASDLCLHAFANLEKKGGVKREHVDCCIVVTQNPDFNIPHVSAIVHGKLGLSRACACFDISLGCSGYVYGLSSIISFMRENDLTNGLLFTADPYSDIIDTEDKNTALLFGDGATVTHISREAAWLPRKFSFGTSGADYKELLCDNGRLYMNGRAIFSFTATAVPGHIQALLADNNLTDADIDRYIFHQGSKYIVDTIRKRLGVSEDKVPFDMAEYGNTVSSSVPIILEKEMECGDNKMLIISGFGVGLSWGSAILEKNQYERSYHESNDGKH